MVHGGEPTTKKGSSARMRSRARLRSLGRVKSQASPAASAWRSNVEPATSPDCCALGRGSPAVTRGGEYSSATAAATPEEDVWPLARASGLWPKGITPEEVEELVWPLARISNVWPLARVSGLWPKGMMPEEVEELVWPLARRV